MEEDASLHLHTSILSGTSITTVVVEAQLAPRARLHHRVLAQEPMRVVSPGAPRVPLPASGLDLTTVVGGWDLARLKPAISQVQGAAVTRLRGLQVARNSKSQTSIALCALRALLVGWTDYAESRC